MRFRRLNEQSSFLRSVREAWRPIDDPIQWLSEPRVWLLTGRCSLRTYTNFDAVFYDWITSRLSAGFQCWYHILYIQNLFNFPLNAGDNSHQAVWWIIGTLYQYLFDFVIVYHRIRTPIYLFFPYCAYGVSWDQRFVSDCWLESVHSLVFHFEMNEHEWLSLNEQEIEIKRRKIWLLNVEWVTSNRCKNVDDN